MYKLVIKTAEGGILLLAGVGDDDKSLREHGENWVNNSGVSSNAVTINVINLVDHTGHQHNDQGHNRHQQNGKQFPEQNGNQNPSENEEKK